MEFMRNGSIKYISMENWMAYTGPVVLNANPGVNIIAASNGSGKSAIVCAIALSLGFDLSILSRGENIRSFVKRGCTKSTLKVGLVDAQAKRGTIDIERRITLTEAPTGKDSARSQQGDEAKHKHQTLVKNEWFLNGKSANLEAIRGLYKRLNIQLDNLLTFLAQANVGKFAAMSQQELFRSTLNAIDAKYVDELDALIDMSHKLKAKHSESKSLEQELQTCNTKLAELKQMSDAMLKVKDAALYRNLVKLKLNQLKLGNITRGHENTRRKIGETNNEIMSLETKFRRVEARHRNMDDHTKSLLAQAKNMIEGANKIMEREHDRTHANAITEEGNEPLEKAFYDSMSMFKSFSNDYMRAQTRQAMSEENAESIRAKMDTVEQDIRGIREQMVSTAELVDAIAKCRVNEEALRHRLRRMSTQAHLTASEAQFDALMNNLPYMKRDLIGKYLRHCKTKGVTPHRIVVEDLKVNGRTNCAIVEDSVGKYLDCVLLKRAEAETNLKLLREFRLPIVTEPSTKNALCRVTDRMRAFGVTAFVHELVEATETTIQCLASLCQINEAFVVDEKAYASKLAGKRGDEERRFAEFYECMLDEISAQLGKRVNTLKYYVGNKKHLYKHFAESNYFMDSETTINTNAKVITDCTNYASSSSGNEREAIEAELEDATRELVALSAKLAQTNELNKHLNRKLYALSRQQVALEKSLKALGTGERRQRNWDRDLEKLKRERFSTITTSIATSANILMRKLEQTAEVKQNLLLADEKYNTYRTKMDELDELTRQVTAQREQIEDLKASLKILQNTYEEQKDRIDGLNANVAEARQAIKNSEELFDSAQFNEEQTRSFGEVRKELENKLINMTEGELEKELAKAEDQVKQLENDDFEEIQLLKMIQDQRTAKERHKRDLEKAREEIGKVTEDRNARYAEWARKVGELVKEIDSKFGRYMKYIGEGADGQVRLDVDPDNVKDAKLRILVKFEREKDLLPLTASYQSGGERGVTTMVYILSVQNLTHNPFFVIDEINQGLDSHYERKLMKLLLGDNEEELDGRGPGAEGAGAPPIPQYFILTPQMISGYDLSSATLHFPLNGPGIEGKLDF